VNSAAGNCASQLPHRNRRVPEPNQRPGALPAAHTVAAGWLADSDHLQPSQIVMRIEI